MRGVETAGINAFVIPAQAGIQEWMPAFAGMTFGGGRVFDWNLS
jgi:hypothetical protein